MSYKKVAIFQYTDNLGTVHDVYLTWKRAELDWQDGYQVRFSAYSSEVDYSNKNLKAVFAFAVTEEELAGINQQFFGQIFASAASPLEAYKAITSEISWLMARTKQFIPHHVRDEDGILDLHMSSLDDLDAVISEVE